MADSCVHCNEMTDFIGTGKLLPSKCLIYKRECSELINTKNLYCINELWWKSSCQHLLLQVTHAKLPHNSECANLLVTRRCAEMWVCLPLLYALKQGHWGVLVYSRGSHEQKIECQWQADVFDATVHWTHPHFLSQCWAGQPTCLGNGLPCCVVGSVTIIERQSTLLLMNKWKEGQTDY